MKIIRIVLSAASLAASISISIGQNTYSSNIVGYATVSVPAGYSILANPLSAGLTNGANEIGLQIDGEQILTWSGTGFNYVSFDSGFGGWIDANLVPSVPPSLPPGHGFFFFNPGNTATNITFVGQVVPGPGHTNTLLLQRGYSVIGSPLPANAGDISAPPVNLPKLDGIQVLNWDNATSKYDYSSYDSGFGGWVDQNFAPINAPSYSIGQGFFLYNPYGGITVVWVQSLP